MITKESLNAASILHTARLMISRAQKELLQNKELVSDWGKVEPKVALDDIEQELMLKTHHHDCNGYVAEIQHSAKVLLNDIYADSI